ncbi:hypothetical protein EYM_01270 [Ignicoccus islandicus DSM 13165]|uniref:Uncharacterized protein n=1 Tax=Ignicoccus islandicus DSM 13165 TaxID=940295 RepID=A0A0U3ECL8_9CREN|nr:hypothetical protein EYM_01270 [Ignicoccus islandicus DSM 13165]
MEYFREEMDEFEVMVEEEEELITLDELEEEEEEL